MSNIIYLQRFLLLSAFVLSAETDYEKEPKALFLMKYNCCVYSYIQKMVV